MTKAKGPAWQEQYGRARRWYRRVAVTSRPLPSDVTDDEIVDEFYAFFLFCFHLKDWLTADLKDQRPTIEDEVEGLCGRNDRRTVVGPNWWLCLCADLANGVKHLNVDRTPRFDVQARLETTVSKPSIEIMNRDDLTATSVTINLNGKLYDASIVARKCMNAWNTFLAERGLVTDNGEYR